MMQNRYIVLSFDKLGTNGNCFPISLLHIEKFNMNLLEFA
jgi:hypothetical protein